MRTIPREPVPSTGLRRDYTQAPLEEIEGYLVGASHDGTWNSYHQTFRYTQRERLWLELIQRLLARLNRRSWLYQEGQRRTVWALETTYHPANDVWHQQPHDRSAWAGYIRGFFDAEGGVPRNVNARFYVQLVQKNREKLDAIRSTLEKMNISCGKLHIPSQAADPDYWRFFVATQSHRAFADLIGSWHPRKSQIFQERMKI